MKDGKVTVYLAGGMEAEVKLGASWRERVTCDLAKYDVEVLNPCEFEPEQLKGLRPTRLPEEMLARSGLTIKPTHWHQLKLAPRTSALYTRFKKYMRRIINYDIHLVSEKVDYIICYWTLGTGKGAGTHAEINTAYHMHKPVYVVPEPGVELPGWIEGCATRVFDTWKELYNFLDEELGQ